MTPSPRNAMSGLPGTSRRYATTPSFSLMRSQTRGGAACAATAGAAPAVGQREERDGPGGESARAMAASELAWATINTTEKAPSEEAATIIRISHVNSVWGTFRREKPGERQRDPSASIARLDDLSTDNPNSFAWSVRQMRPGLMAVLGRAPGHAANLRAAGHGTLQAASAKAWSPQAMRRRMTRAAPHCGGCPVGECRVGEVSRGVAP